MHIEIDYLLEIDYCEVKLPIKLNEKKTYYRTYT